MSIGGTDDLAPRDMDLRHWSGNPDVKQWAWRARAALEELREAMHDVVADDIARAEQPRRLM